MAWDWQKIIKTIGDVSTGALTGMKINEWLAMGESDALNSIENFVNQSSVETIDLMDSVLLDRVNIEFDAVKRKQVVKYYTYFKLGEYNKYGKWRGFPS